MKGTGTDTDDTSLKRDVSYRILLRPNLSYPYRIRIVPTEPFAATGETASRGLRALRTLSLRSGSELQTRSVSFSWLKCGCIVPHVRSLVRLLRTPTVLKDFTC